MEQINIDSEGIWLPPLGDGFSKNESLRQWLIKVAGAPDDEKLDAVIGRFKVTKDYEEGRTHCGCEHVIYKPVVIQARETGRETIIGSCCVKRLGESLRRICEVVGCGDPAAPAAPSRVAVMEVAGIGRRSLCIEHAKREVEDAIIKQYASDDAGFFHSRLRAAVGAQKNPPFDRQRLARALMRRGDPRWTARLATCTELFAAEPFDINLTVPFAKKEAAKALGAKWDHVGKTWYAPWGKCREGAITDLTREFQPLSQQPARENPKKRRRRAEEEGSKEFHPDFYFSDSD